MSEIDEKQFDEIFECLLVHDRSDLVDWLIERIKKIMNNDSESESEEDFDVQIDDDGFYSLK